MGRKPKYSDDPNSPMWVQRLATLIDEDDRPQYYLADIAPATPATISNWLNGKSEPTISQFVNIANHFNVTLNYLWGYDEGKTIEKQKVHEISGLSNFAIENLQTNLAKMKTGNEVVSGDSEKRLAVCNFLVENMETSTVLSSLYDYFFGTARIQNVGQDVSDNMYFVVKSSPTGKEKKYKFSEEVFAHASYVKVQDDLMKMKRTLTTSILKETLKDWVTIKERV